MPRLAALTAALWLGLSAPDLASSSAAAEPSEEADATRPAEKVYSFPEIVVSAPRPVTTVGGASAVETHVDSLAVPPAATVEEVLRELPLLHVRRNSRGEAELSARGSESRQVAVLVDGVPITLAWDARADVSVIPATALQDVTFIRGLSSMLYGPNVLGGIVEAKIGQAPAQPEAPMTQVTMGADHVGTFGTTITTAVPLGSKDSQWLVRGGVGYRNSPGDPLAAGVHEPIPVDDELRLNTDAERVDGFVALRYRAGSGAWMAFSGSAFREERGIAAELGVPDEDARLWRYPHVSRTLAVLSGGTGFHDSPLGGQGDVEASIGFDRGRTDIDAYTSRAYDQLDSFEDGKDRTLTFRVLADQTMGRRGDLRAAFTLSDIHHDETIPDGSFEYQQRLWSGGLENEWQLVQAAGALQSLALSVGGAYDVGETPKTGGREPLGQVSEWGGRVGLSAVVGGGGTVLHAGISRRGRFPALRELYSGAINRFAPNPDLQPEKLVTAETGVTARVGEGEVQAVAFHNRLDDAVVRTTLEDGRFMRVNRNELRSTGLELLGSYRVGRVDLAANLTLQDVELRDPQADVTNRPENLPEVFGELQVAGPLAVGLLGGAGVEFTGEQFAIDPATGQDVELDARALVHAHLSRAWPVAVSWGAGTFGQLEARLAVDNLGDTRLYDSAGLPEPGRRVRFELRLR